MSSSADLKVGVIGAPARARNFEVTVKRFKRGKGRVLLMPRNPNYAPIEVPEQADFAIEGLYCGLVRRG